MNLHALALAVAVATPAKMPQTLLDVRAEWAAAVDVEMTMSNCGGDDNAFYFPSLQVVVVCKPLFEQHPLAAEWVLHHELGHAWMYQHNVPNSERAADELALLMSTKDQALAAAEWFEAMAKGSLTSGDDGSHQTHQDRADAIRCVTYGLHAPEQTTSFCRMYASSIAEQWGRILYLAP